MTDFHARETLGLRDPDPSRLTPRASLAVVVALTGHWVGAGGELYRPNEIERLRAIQADHMDRRDFGDIAYEGAFDADGNTYGLRDSHWVGAHCASNGNRANVLSDGIVFLEDYRGWTAAAQTAWHWWVDLFMWSHGKAPALFSHRGWQRWGGISTECAGPQFNHVIALAGGIA